MLPNLRKEKIMKKILSLVLAVMMMLSLAVSSSAVFILGSDGSYIKGTNDSVADIDDLIDLYKHLYSSDCDVPYYGYIGNGLVPGWYKICDDCGEFMYCYIYGGKLITKCLNTKCGVEEDDDDMIVGGGNVSLNGKVCTSCGKTNTIYIEAVKYGGTIYNRYYCVNCRDFFIAKNTEINLDSYKADIDCIKHGCTKKAVFQKFVLFGDDLYAYYKCESGHVASILAYEDFEYEIEEDYVIKTGKTGHGTIDVDGGAFASYGDERTIRIKPDKGYVLADVYVNGKSMGADEEFTLKITGNTFIYAYFVKANTLKTYDLEAEAVGNGRVTARKNGAAVSASAIEATYADTVVYTFTPASKNYYVDDVTVNGKSVGAVSTYTVKKASADLDIVVTFAWKSPYCDVANNYLAAVEYVTEAGIMTTYRQNLGSRYFSGRTGIYTQTFVSALAEMADTAGVLDNADDRLAWAADNGIITSEDELFELIDVQTAAKIVDKYLEVLEDINDISFKNFNAKADAKTNAAAIELANETTYEKNRNLHRYDLASVCYLIANLEINE